MTTDPTAYSQVQIPSSQTSTHPVPLSRRQEHEHRPSPTKNSQEAPLSSPAITNSIDNVQNSHSRSDSNFTQNATTNMMLTTYAQTPPSQYSHNLASQESQPVSKSSSVNMPATSSASSPSSGRLTLPKPPSRLPVRMGLSDPRVHNYLSPKSAAAVSPRGVSTSTTTATARAPLSISRQDQAPMRSNEPSRAAAVSPGTGMYRSTETSPLRPHSYRAQQSSTAPQSRPNGASIDPSHRADDYWKRGGSTHRHAHPNGVDRYHSESHSPSARVHSSSPGHLPSPSPSGPSSSPESMLMAPETTWVGHGKGHWFDSANSDMGYQLKCEDQRDRLQRLDLSSPPTSDADLCMESRTYPSLFHPYGARSQGPSSSTRAPPGSSHLSATSALGPVKMTASLSASSNASSSSTATMNSFNPLTDSRAISPPLSCITLSSKHHHPRIPIRSPERDGQDLMMTSTIDTNSSAYLNMDYYNIYRTNPKLLRPEGGRHDDRRPHVNQATEDSIIHHSHARPKGKAKAYVGGMSGKSPFEGGGAKRKHSISLQSTATHRVLRNEVAHPNGGSSQDIVNSLGIAESSTRASSRMSISHLLASDDEDDDDDSSSIVMTGNVSESGGIIGEPSNRKRLSKKRAGELGLLDEYGNIRGRKKTKKVHDPDQLSPAGFRHGGERTVQEPDEPIIIDPTVGPVDVLDRITLPTVYWKGHPMPVVGRPGYQLLHPHEAHIASTLRLSPAQYLGCKRTLILASREYHARQDGKQFRKSDAQKLCRIDVNKTSRLWEVFARIGWLEGIGEKDI